MMYIEAEPNRKAKVNVEERNFSKVKKL